MLNMQNFNKKKILKKVVSDTKNRYNSKQLRQGFEVEKEHTDKLGKDTDVVKGDGMVISKITMAHLKEMPKYYTHLKEMESKYKK